MDKLFLMMFNIRPLLKYFDSFKTAVDAIVMGWKFKGSWNESIEPITLEATVIYLLMR